jgi:hypothetical protein
MRFRRLVTRFSAVFSLAVTVAFLAGAANASAMPASHVFSAIDSAASFPSYSTSANRNGYVVLQAWQTQRMQELKRANPNIKVLVYKNLAFSASGSSPEGTSPSGVAYAEAKPTWFLKNTSGQSFTANSYNWLWAMDIGSREYQEKWAENVIAEMTAKGWDGVMLDDASTTMKYSYTPSAIVKYPNDAAYSAAMESALAYIGPRIQAAGKLAIPNFASWVEYPQTYDNWLQYVSGGLDEMFVKWGRGAGEGYRGSGQWRTQVEEARYANQHGKIFLAYTQGAVNETQAARYGYASLLMGSESASQASYAFTPNYSNEQWVPEYEYEIGSPTAAATADPTGVYRRTFSNGLVLVNPTGVTQTVSFGGTYSGSGLTDATSATLAPDSSLILTGESAPAPPVVVAPPVPVPPKPGPPKVEPITVTVTVGHGEITLSWTPATTEAKTFEIVRDNTKVAKTTRRHRKESKVRTGKRYSYRIYGYNKSGKVVAKSKTLKVRPAEGARHVVKA